MVSELNKRARAIQNVEEAEHSAAQKIDGFQEEEKKPADPNVYVYEPEDATGWLIAAYVLAILGGLLGIVIGIMVYNQKIIVNGEKEYKYKQSHRQFGLGAAILAVISIIIWNIALT